MKTFSVYKHPTLGYEAVKQGFGWPAFFFSVIWAFLSRMWGHGFAFAGVFLLLNLFEAEFEKLGHENVVLGMSLANIAFCIMIGMLGNEWREENLIKRGFKKLSTVEAETKDAAIAKVETISSDSVEHQKAPAEQKIRTHYDNLQVAEDASIEVIRGAYKSLSQKWHPDKCTNDDEKKNADRIMRIINEAYSVLSDPEQRKEHDAWISEQRTQSDEKPSERPKNFQEKPEKDVKQNKVKPKGFFRQENPIVHILFVTLITAGGTWYFMKMSSDEDSESVKPKETLINSASGMKHEAHGTQQPRYINEIGEGASTAQQSDSPVQPINQRFPKEKLATYLDLDIFTIKLQPEENNQYLQVGLTVKARETEVVQEIAKQMPTIRNRILMLLSSKKAVDISDINGKQELSLQIADEIRKTMDNEDWQEDIREVLFTSFVIQ